MGSTAIIDNDILGWGHDVKDLKIAYERIIPIGSIPELPSDSKDERIGGYCYEHGCDLFTADVEAYNKFFRDARIKSVIITNYAIYEVAKKKIFRVQIIKT